MKSTSKRILNRPQIINRRRGAVLIVAMVCTLLTAMILGTLLRITLTRTQLAKQHERSLQAEWLAEAGIERAAAVLSKNPDYTGETWRLTPVELPGQLDAAVRITVQAAPQQSGARTITAVADYPVDLPRRTRCTKQIELRLTPQPPALPGDAE